MAKTQKTMIVTGASQGIGAGVVKAFLDRGYSVVANSRNINKSGAFEVSDKLALVDGNISDSAIAAKIALRLRKPNLDRSMGLSTTLAYFFQALHGLHDR
jgi:NAD(P)-dependent dehydrogenase (short-subunit alcohol dehydrogenase family)